jgi:hypothetical protein
MLTLTSTAKYKNDNEARIDKTWKENARTLALQEIDTKELLEYAECCYLFNDILVVQNYENSGKHILEFVDINTMKIKRQALMIGNGPGEVIKAIIRKSGTYLTVDDFMKARIAQIDVAAYMSDQEPVVGFREYGFDTQNLDFWDERRFICLNPYRFINRKLKINQDEPRFLILEANDEIPHKKDQVEALDINYGDILINKKAGKVCFVSYNTPSIEFYDSILRPINTLTGPDELNPEYSIRNNYVLSGSDIVRGYFCSTYNDTDIWLAYDGRMLSLMEILDNGGAITSSDSYIFRLDWDGNIRESYRLHKDKKIKSMSIGPKGELYMSCEVEGILKLFIARM